MKNQKREVTGVHLKESTLHLGHMNMIEKKKIFAVYVEILYVQAVKKQFV
jgi:hypothetical protein